LLKTEVSDQEAPDREAVVSAVSNGQANEL
jgi:hypothetical protein